MSEHRELILFTIDDMTLSIRREGSGYKGEERGDNDGSEVVRQRSISKMRRRCDKSGPFIILYLVSYLLNSIQIRDISMIH